MLSDLVFNHPLACAVVVVVIAYGIGGAAIVWGNR